MPVPPPGWPSDCLRMPTASISSMKTMHCPPHLRASRFAFAASQRTVIASMPMNVWAKPEPGMETNGALNPVAIALESIVLPVPGAPRKRRPRSRLPPAASKASPDCQSETTRRTSSFTSAWPRTSSSLTPQSASPGSNDWICETAISRSGPNRIRKFMNSSAGRKIMYVQNVGLLSSPAAPVKKLVAVSNQLVLSKPRNIEISSQAAVIKVSTTIARRTQRRQNHARRRARTSSSLSRGSSVPKRLGHGITRRMKTSTIPRNAMAPTIAPTRAQRQFQPKPRWRKKNAAGLVRMATNVAARVSVRHCRAS